MRWLPIPDNHLFLLITQTACCSEGCENCCGDARYELHDPLEGFLLSHTLPPSFTFILYHLSFPKDLISYPSRNRRYQCCCRSW